MERRRIGRLEVSVVGLGGNTFGTDFFGPGCDAQTTSRIVNAALDAGVNLIDTAEEYSITSFLGEGHSEEYLGAALGRRRDEAVIATKFLSRDQHDAEAKGAHRIVAAVEASLRRLGTDRIDLYQQHQPDPERMPSDEVLEALGTLVRDGKVLEIGCCNFTGEMLESSHQVAAESELGPFRSCQVQYNILERPSADLLQSAEALGVPLLAYFPLASGLLTGKYGTGLPVPEDARLGADGMVSRLLRDGLMAARPPLSPERLATIDALSAFAADHGRTLLELAVSWLVAQPTVGSVLTGATRPEQIEANAAAAAWQLTGDDLRAVDAILAAEGEE